MQTPFKAPFSIHPIGPSLFPAHQQSDGYARSFGVATSCKFCVEIIVECLAAGLDFEPGNDYSNDGQLWRNDVHKLCLQIHIYVYGYKDAHR